VVAIADPTPVGAALEYATRGWAVLPVWWPDATTPNNCACNGPKGKCKPAKHPIGTLVPHGVKQATRTEATIRAWWKRYPLANVGVATGGTSGFDVLDADGEAGLQRLNDLDLPRTPASITGSLGRHALFQHRPGLRNAVRFAPGLDVRTDDGYIVAPPSLHTSGRRYTWDAEYHPSDVPLAQWPPDVYEQIRNFKQAQATNGTHAKKSSIPEGSRNATLTSFAGIMRRGAMTEDEILAGLRAINSRRCAPPLEDEELEAIAESVAHYDPADPVTIKAHRNGTAPREPGCDDGLEPALRAEVTLVRMSDVVEREVRWLWRPRIPRGYLTLLEGDPGLGKSFLSVQLISAVTTGRSLPDDCAAYHDDDPANVLLMGAEDGLEDTVRPRLTAAGADLTRVLAIKGLAVPSRDGKTREVALSLANIEEIERVFATHRPRLVIIDPIQAYLGAGVDAHRANETRPLLAGLARLAQTYDSSIVLIRHLAKGTGGTKLIYRGMMSIDFIGAARSALQVTVHPEDAELPPRERRRVVFHVKSNLDPQAEPLGFRLGQEGFAWEPGTLEVSEESVRVAEGVRPSNRGQAPALGRPADARRKAEAWLLDFLSDGPKPRNYVLAAGEDKGFVDRTLYRAFAAIQGVRTGGTGGNPAIWGPPGTRVPD
jgi:hypothetical protein